MTEILRDPNLLNPETRSLWDKQEGIIKIYNLPFRLFETKRSPERQQELYDHGYSKTLNSHHLTGDAWDVAHVTMKGWDWDQIFWYQVLGILTVNLIADIRWGADWNGKELWWDERFKDFGHYERIKS
jgi:peptidoglycan L-alanyl-D-glutamate endopeptidase CwlK